MSRLFERMAVPCAMVAPSRVPDGEGGWKAGWAQGDRFEAAIAKDASTAARVAESEGVRNVYTVTTSRALAFGDVFRRLSDGQCFRVASNADDGAAPRPATFRFNQCSAEEWEVPDG